MRNPWTKIKHKRTIVGILIFMGLITTILEFQNCAPSGGGSSGLTFGNGTSSTSTPTSTGLALSVLPSSASSAAGAQIGFVATVSGGTAPYSYTWLLNGGALGNCPSSTSSCTVTAAGSGVVPLNVTVTDATGASSTYSVPITVTAGVTPLSASIASTATSTQTNTAVTLTASGSGGQSPYSYTWNTAGATQQSCSSSSPTCTVSYSSAGNYTASVTVNDANNSSATSSALSITASVASPSPTPTPTPSACTQPIGKIETAVVDPSTCNITVTGWAWNPSMGQSTKVSTETLQVAYGSGTCSTVVVTPRPDVLAAHPCITGNPGFTCVIPSAGFWSNQGGVLDGIIQNSSGGNALTLNWLSFDYGGCGVSID